MKNKLIGIYVDAENTLNPSVILPIIQSAQRAGKVCALIVFGNWTSPFLAAWNEPKIQQALRNLGAVKSPVPRLRPGKNSADIALTYEAAIMVENGTVNEVWIVSGDSDFTPFIERLQQKDVRVVVFGPKNSPESLRRSCSSFVLMGDIENSAETISIEPPNILRPN